MKPKKLEEKFQKMNINFEEYKKCIFENIKESSDEEQSKAFVEASKIEDRVTKIKIRIYRKNSIK